MTGFSDYGETKKKCKFKTSVHVKMFAKWFRPKRADWKEYKVQDRSSWDFGDNI